MMLEAEKMQQIPGLTLVKTVDLNSVILGKSDLIELWELGVLSPLAYVYMALKYDGLDNPIDVEGFIFCWQGISDPDTGKAKRLSKKQLLAAVATLEEKEIVEFKPSQLCLSFSFGEKS
ncbi:hypothetical protein H6F43_04275 [Leptolyngbya sp. FACHB-36]|uniref:hypothetical protein n=1 Tax=Leptolyngbya sp. FACHB-36 TaxID=2692808 RepID=UPI00168028FD|nr:hypothetical protein [Leptolyngbya sp. FACHB-36]MBD2019400.1 hypothetical protein [Leptolyngbya sp. FACHB-36]